MIFRKNFVAAKAGAVDSEVGRLDLNGNDILVVGLNQSVPLSQITFGSTTLQVKP